MERIAITGHLSGLGKELYNRIPNSIGFDLGSNHDIANPDPWISTALNCDVFINNAYCGFHQVNLLEEFFKEWQFTNKTIINIGSCASDISKIDYIKKIDFYPIHKKALDDACTRLQHVKKTCRIVNVKIGWMDTPLVKDVDVEKISVDKVADVILDCLKNKNISNVTVGGDYVWNR